VTGSRKQDVELRLDAFIALGAVDQRRDHCVRMTMKIGILQHFEHGPEPEEPAP